MERSSSLHSKCQGWQKEKKDIDEESKNKTINRSNKNILAANRKKYEAQNHACSIYIMSVYAQCTYTHTYRQTVKQSYAIQFHVYFTNITECTGSLMPLDGSSSITLQHLLPWTW